MLTELSKTIGTNKPDGWPYWIWHLVRIFVPIEYRTELMSPDQRAQTARALADKLTESKNNAKEWRERALAVEKIYCDQYTTMREAARNHDGLSWRI